MISEEKLRALLEIVKDSTEYCGVIEETDTTNQNDCKKFSYDVKGLAINLAKPIAELNNRVFKSGIILNKNCDGLILCSNGKIILVELKTNPLDKDKFRKALEQIIASYISLCALLYIFSLDIRNFSVEIIIAGCKRKQDLYKANIKMYSKNEILMLCIDLVDRGSLTIKFFPKDILKLLKFSEKIELHPDIHKSDVPVSYYICDNCKEPA